MGNLADLTIGLGLDNRLSAGLDGVPGDADEAVTGIENKFKGLKDKLPGIAKAAGVAAGAAIVAGALEGLERGNLNDKLASQLDLTGREAETAGNVAGDLFNKGLSDSMGDVNEAVRSVVGGGLADLGDTEAVERLSSKALSLSNVFGQDLATNVSNAGTLVEKGLAKDADEAFDLIVAGSQKVKPALLDELGEATTEYSKFFGDLGFTGEEMFSLLASADDRFALDKTGDAIKELSDRGVDLTSEVKGAYDALGLNAEETADKLLAGGETAGGAVDQIISRLAGMENPTEQAAAAVALLGEPINDLGKSNVPAFLESLNSADDGLGDFEGSADDVADRMDNGSRKVQAWKNRFRSMLASVTEAPGIVGDATTAVAGLGSALQPMGPAIAGVGFLFRDQLSGMASKAGSTMKSAAKATGKGAKNAGKALAGWIASIGKWVAAQVAAGAKALASMAATAAKFVAHYARMAAAAAVNAAKMAASWIVAMGPIGWIIAGVVALVALIIANWDTVKEWTARIWGWVSDKVASAWRWISDKTMAAVSAVVGFVRDLRDKAIEIITAIVDFVKTYHPIMILWRLAKEWVPKVVQWFIDLNQRAIAKVRELKDRAVETFTRAKDLILGVASLIKTKVVEFFTGLRDSAVERITDLVDDVRGIKDTVLGFFAGAKDWLLDAGENIISGLIDGIKDAIPDIGGAVDSVVSEVTDRLPWSPAKKGPLRRNPPEQGGRNIIDQMVSGMHGGGASVVAEAERIARMAAIGMSPDDLGFPVIGAGGRRPLVARSGFDDDAARRGNGSGSMDGVTINNYYPAPEPATEATGRSLRKAQVVLGL